MQYRFYTADVFSDHIFGGNQLAVFPHAEGLDSRQMQQVAREFNLSETVFVFPAEKVGHHRRLRIFTPKTELPFAGHPTIGAAFVLAAIGEIPLNAEHATVLLEEEVGPLSVSVRAVGSQPVYTELSVAKLPEFGPEPPAVEAIASMLSLQPADILEAEAGLQAVSCGVPFLFVPLQNLEALRRVQLNLDQWQRQLSNYWAPHLYVFTNDPELKSADLRARMFAPAMGIDEDPATGAAAAALAGYLGNCNNLADGTIRWTVEQGFEMGRPSLLRVEADKQNQAIAGVRVGGASVLVSQGTMEIPPQG